MTEVRDGNGRLLGKYKDIRPQGKALYHSATIEALSKQVEELLADLADARPRRDPCPQHYTGDPELPCRCAAPAEGDVVVHPKPGTAVLIDNLRPEDYIAPGEFIEIKFEVTPAAGEPQAAAYEPVDG